MAEANITKDLSGRIVVSFTYAPSSVTKIKTIEGRRCHPAEKHWSFPYTDGLLEKILKVFGHREVQIDPALQANLTKTSSGDDEAKHEQSQFRFEVRYIQELLGHASSKTTPRRNYTTTLRSKVAPRCNLGTS